MTFAQAKPALIAVAVAAYLGLATAGTMYGAGMLYRAFLKQPTEGVRITTVFEQWDSTTPESKERKKLKFAIGLPAALLFLGVPIAILSAGGRKRELHGSARFANAKELRDAGLMVDDGIVIGKHAGKFLHFAGKQSVLLSAPHEAARASASWCRTCWPGRTARWSWTSSPRTSRSPPAFVRSTGKTCTRGLRLPKMAGRIAGIL